MSFKILTLLFIAFTVSCSSKENLDGVDIDIKGNNLFVEVAATPQERQRGLMERESLEKNSGMIFVFETEQPVSFWMKNTSIPLSIAYINKHGVILEIYNLEPYSIDSIQSKRSSIKYALEVNRGYFKDMGIVPGDKIDLSPVLNYLKSSK